MTTSPTSPRTNIFFTGTVHDAINTSVQQRHALVCFVTDGGEESLTWESEYLTDAEVSETANPRPPPALPDALRALTVLTRLSSGV
jgi:hypothetical protein